MSRVTFQEGLSDEELVGRILGGRWTSLTTGEVYHLENDPPPGPEEGPSPGPFPERDDDTVDASGPMEEVTEERGCTAG